MAQIQQLHNQYPNPFAYFANTHVSIQKRKGKATGASNMKIVNLTQNPDNSFNVLIKGNRGMTYEVLFSEQSITCSCPDFQKHTVKPICKHMFKLICISENHDIFNNSMILSDLMNPQYLERILTSTLRIIDIKKMERYGGPQNQISIERDECCPICYGDFDLDISQCFKCKHVFHKQCIYLSWNSASYNARGKCPMCRESNSFPNIQGGNGNSDPWEIYNFPAPEPSPAPQSAPQSAPQPAPQSAPQQPQDELVHLDDGPNLPVENPNNFLFPEQFIDAPPIPPAEQEDNAGQAPNEDPDDISSSGGHPPIEIPSLSEYEENDRIESRIQILNISLFVLEAINIIFNQITYIQPQE
jgi:hypothetical protein